MRLTVWYGDMIDLPVHTVWRNAVELLSQKHFCARCPLTVRQRERDCTLNSIVTYAEHVEYNKLYVANAKDVKNQSTPNTYNQE